MAVYKVRDGRFSRQNFLSEQDGQPRGKQPIHSRPRGRDRDAGLVGWPGIRGNWRQKNAWIGAGGVVLSNFI